MIKFLSLSVLILISSNVRCQDKNKALILFSDSLSMSHLDFVKKELSDFFYLVDEIVFELTDELKSEIDTILCGDCIIKSMEFKFRSSNDKIFVITEKPLTIFRQVPPVAIDKVLVRGYATIGGPVCTISTYKISKESKSKSDFTSSLSKVIAHESKHLIGLQHCSESSCLMSSGYNFEFNSGILCQSCQLKLDSLTY